MNVSALARRHGILAAQLFGWCKAFLKRQNIVAPVPAGPPTAMVEIVVGEVMIRVSADVSEAALRRILRAVR